MNSKIEINKWKIEVNDRYYKLVEVIIGLSTASLVLPLLFFREFLGIEKGDSLDPYINWKIWSSWVLLVCAIVFGCSFLYCSAKWIKHSYGQKTFLSEKVLEKTLDFLFWFMVVSFVLGLFAFCLVFLR